VLVPFRREIFGATLISYWRSRPVNCCFTRSGTPSAVPYRDRPIQVLALVMICSTKISQTPLWFGNREIATVRHLEFV